ncbi:MAG: LysE family translocator [Rhizobiaceae bacterium]|nr:LysE family translocator [Rhizobiaceae bacterium]MCV0408543.1 LysE family translocator [Rhizobiaceae bacterium]
MGISLEAYLAYVATVLVFFAHPPGPGQLLFMAHSTRLGALGALPVMIGNHTANIIQMLLAGFGLAGAVATSAEVFFIVKWLGIAYLIWFGLTMMKQGSTGTRPRQANRNSLFRQGFVTAAANPFAVMFFAALFPQFLTLNAPLVPQIAALGVTYLVIDGIILLAMGASTSRIMSMIGVRATSRINRVSGALMIGAALLLAFRGIEPEPDR